MDVEKSKEKSEKEESKKNEEKENESECEIEENGKTGEKVIPTPKNCWRNYEQCITMRHFLFVGNLY